MTIAEQLKEMGVDQARREIAVDLLKEGADPRFISRISRLELSEVLKLKTELENSDKL